MPSSKREDPFTLRCSSCPARKLALGLAVVAVATCVLLWVLIILFIHTRKARARSSTRPSLSPARRYAYADLGLSLFSSHDRCNPEEGGSSSFYPTGNLSDGSVVFIKKLSDQGLIKEPAFTSEIEGISRIRHRNLLHLRGFCYEDGHAILVYDHAPFCLYHFLFDSNGVMNSVNGHINTGFVNGNSSKNCINEVALTSRPLNGSARLKILQGVAAALVHLHENCVLHRDVRAANVLLTEDFEPRLGDSGVARLITRKSRDGLPPYIAPEVAYTGKATEKADVFSFGVLALEVVSGRQVVDGQFRLIDWVWTLYQSNNLMDALDPACMHDSDGGGTTTSDAPLSTNNLLQWQCVFHVALLCCHPLMESRPSMRQVSMVLQESIIMPLPTRMPPNPNFSSEQTLVPV